MKPVKFDRQTSETDAKNSTSYDPNMIYFIKAANSTTGKIIMKGVEYGGSGQEFKYTNSTAMPTAVGGFAANTTFSNATLQDLFDGLLYPYINPTASLTVSPTEFEKGVSTTLTYTISGTAGTKAVSKYYIGGSEITKNANNTYTASYTVTDTTTKSGYVTDEGNKQSVTVSKTATAKYRCYIDVSSSKTTVPSLDSASLLTDARIGSKVFNCTSTNKYIWVVIPKTLWNLLSIENMGAPFNAYTKVGADFTRNGTTYVAYVFNNEYYSNQTFTFK